MRLTNIEVSKFLEANITTETELFAQAHSQKAAGKKDLANFLLSWFSKALNDIIVNNCKMESAQQKLDRADIARMDIINNNALWEYVPECQDIWIKCTNEVLQTNNVPVAEFGGVYMTCQHLVEEKTETSSFVTPPTEAKLFY